MKQVNYSVRRIWNGWIVKENAPNGVERFFSTLKDFAMLEIIEKLAEVDQLASCTEGRGKFNGREYGFLFELNGDDDLEI